MLEIAGVNQIVPDTSKEAVGYRIRLTREARGLNQAALAKVLQVSPQKWNTYERGVAMIQPPLLAQFCALTGSTSDWIYLESMATLPMALAQKIKGLIEAEEQARASEA